MRQQVPSTPAASHVEDGVEDFAAAVFRRTAAGFHGRHERFQLFPFRLGEVRIIRGSRGVHLSGKRSPLFKLALSCRGRDADCSTPPAQIRTCGTPAYGSYLGWVASKRA